MRAEGAEAPTGAAEASHPLRVLDGATPPEVPARAVPPPLARPVGRRWRFLHAYLVTFLVVGSYVWLKVKSKLLSPATVEAQIVRTHLRNARRIERAIGRLQGLFIKVGQLISIMTNFLPEEFRA